jgi:hypothetical protein
MTAMNLTKLEGVNRVLRAARERPVSALGTATENDSLMAEQILDEILMREQMTGQHVNTTEAQFTPDGTSGYVVLPTDTLAVAGSNQHVARNYYHRETDGGVYLYDSDGIPGTWGATRDFSSTGTDDDTVYCRITQCMTFEDLPVQHQFSIVDQAAVEYQQHVMGSNSVDNQLQARAARSRAIARAYDMRSRPNNQFDDGRSQGPRMGRFTPRGWPYNDQRRS